VFFRQPADRDPSDREPWNRQAPWNRPRYPYGGYRGDGSQTGPLPRQPVRPRSYSRWDEDRETTRYLSARTQLFISYADYVVREIVNEEFRALAPAYGVDLAAVAKWAIGSLRRRRRRDLALSVILVAGLAMLILVGLFARYWPGVAATAGVTLLLGWAVTMTEYLDRYRCVHKHMLRGQFNPDDAPEPADPQQRDRLRAVSRHRSGNLVVFRGRRAFAGSGFRVPKVGGPLVIDVSKGRSDDDDDDDGPEISGIDQNKNKKKKKKRPDVTPDPFTNEDVHAAIVEAMDDLGLRDVWVEERLFVNGRHIQGDPDYLPSPHEPPTTSVNPALLRQAIRHPTPDARVYVCVEMRGWQGQLIVTLFARAVHLGGSLYIEWSFYVLPPVSPSFQSIDYLYDAIEVRRFWRAALRRARRTPRTLVLAPLAVGRSYWEERSAKRYIARQRRAIDRGQVFDYGASRSAREYAAGWQRQHYFLERDEIMFILVAQEKLTRVVRDFLKARNVDLEQLEPQIKVINDNASNFYNVRIGEVSNSSFAMGKLTKSKTDNASNDKDKKEDD
jgi:hypothetical protein